MTFDAMLKMTKVKIPFHTNQALYEDLEDSLTGGLAFSATKYAKSKKPTKYDKNWTHIMYFDVKF